MRYAATIIVIMVIAFACLTFPSWLLFAVAGLFLITSAVFAVLDFKQEEEQARRRSSDYL